MHLQRWSACSSLLSRQAARDGSGGRGHRAPCTKQPRDAWASCNYAAMSEQTPAGWYPDGQGVTRWWDGTAWTEHTQEAGPKKGSVLKERASQAASRFSSAAVNIPIDALWSAVGKPLSGIGAGKYWLDDHHLYFERGTLRTDSQQVPISQVMDVDVKQTMAQKARGVFTLTVRIQRSTEIETVLMEDIPDGREAQRIINGAAHAARARLQQAQNTMRYEGTHPAAAPAPPAPATPAASSSGDDLIAQIAKLGDLHAQGILSAEEFAAAKQRLINE